MICFHCVMSQNMIFIVSTIITFLIMGTLIYFDLRGKKKK